MLGVLCWCVYYWINLLQEKNRKNIILFVIFAVLSIYSQYGAGFPVIVMIMIAYWVIIKTWERQKIVFASAVYGITFITTALPLFYFFLIRQMKSQQGLQMTHNMIFDRNIIYDLFKNFAAVIKWCFFTFFDSTIIIIAVCVIALAILYTTIKTKNVVLRWLLVCNVVTWILYYLAVKMKYYAYGEFGNRYNIFIIPMILILCFVSVIEFVNIIRNSLNRYVVRSKSIIVGLLVLMGVFYLISNLTVKIIPNWEKDDMRDAVKIWFAKGADKSNTIVYYGGNSGFAYYIRTEAEYNESTEKNVHYMKWLRDGTVSDYSDYVSEVYYDSWPDEIYLIGTHMMDDFNTLVEAIKEKGYLDERLFNKNGVLIKFTVAEH